MPSTVKLSDELAGILIAAANEAGGWGYYPGKLSRIEPTCWAMLALADETSASSDAHPRFLVSRQRPDGLLSDRSDLPANITWSALSFLTLSTLRTSTPTNDCRERLLGALVETAGVQLPNSPTFRQNNQLKGWSWMPETFSWVEPTSWCLLGLKRAVRASPDRRSESIGSRIAQGEALLIDRACDSGGWNYGNPDAFGTGLPAHIPTTALGLVALQDKRGLPVVERSLAFVEEHWRREQSGSALALSLICLKIYGRATEEIEAALLHQWQRTRFLGNLAATSMACCALNMNSSAIDALTLS